MFKLLYETPSFRSKSETLESDLENKFSKATELQTWRIPTKNDEF